MSLLVPVCDKELVAERDVDGDIEIDCDDEVVDVGSLVADCVIELVIDFELLSLVDELGDDVKDVDVVDELVKLIEGDEVDVKEEDSDGDGEVVGDPVAETSIVLDVVRDGETDIDGDRDEDELNELVNDGLAVWDIDGVDEVLGDTDVDSEFVKDNSDVSDDDLL